MSDVQLTAVQVPKKLYWVRFAERDASGSVVRKLYTIELPAVNAEAAKIAATVQATNEGVFKDVDVERIASAVGELTLT